MDWSTSTNPLEKTAGETAKANQALVDYALLGASRSLSILHRTYTEDAPKKASKKAFCNLRTLKEWSTKYAWQERVARFDALQRAEALEAWHARAEDLRDREWKLAQALMDKAEQMLKFPLAEVERTNKVETSEDGKTIIYHITQMNPARWFFADAARVIREASRVARLATGQETDHNKHTGEVTQIGMTLDEWTKKQAERNGKVAETLAKFKDE